VEKPVRPVSSTRDLDPLIPSAARAIADEAPPRPYKWAVPGVPTGPAPPTPARADKNLEGVPVNERSAARAAASAKGFQEGVVTLVKHINGLGGKTTFGKLFDDYENKSDSLNGFLMIAKRDRLIKYNGEMLLYPMNKGVEITLTDKAKEMLRN
jgi:hypothetical protein